LQDIGPTPRSQLVWRTIPSASIQYCLEARGG
jgi:hypothetical protein